MWKDIKGFENYEVSDIGQVRNKTTGCILKGQDNGRGYLEVGLHSNKKRKHKYIHRLVAEAFIPNPNHKPEVNHMDEDKTNNHVSNLEWVTHRENNNYGTKNERMKNSPGWRKNRTELLQRLRESNSIPIIVIYEDNTYEEYPSASVAARELGLWRQNIVDVLKGRAKTTGGLRFEYAEE